MTCRMPWMLSVSLVAVLCSGQSVWDGPGVRPGAGGLEAGRATWTRTSHQFSRIVERDHAQWSVPVGGDARPSMRRLRIESLSGTIRYPWIRTGHGYDFRSVPQLVNSILGQTRDEEQKALALRELLIGEGFYFHHSVPPEQDPIRRLTSYGYGFCGVHAQIYDELARAAGLRSAVCGHPYEYGHATNQVYYASQWHFIDTDGEAFFRRPDGVIPSYADIRAHPELVPAGDAYGQTAEAITSARYARALYTADVKCTERAPATNLTYATLDYTLRPHEAIEWNWRDADFSRERRNVVPVFATGRFEYPVEIGHSAGPFVVPVQSPYALTGIEVRIHQQDLPRDLVITATNGNKTIPLARNGQVWRVALPDREPWYQYRLEVSKPVLFTLVSTFRFYPQSMPWLAVGPESISYEDQGAEGTRRVRITIDWEEEVHAAGVSRNAADWGWQTPMVLPGSGELPVLTEGSGGILHLVYSSGSPGHRRIAYRQYANGKWSEARFLTPENQDANHPVAAEDGTGRVWVAYQTGGLWEGGDVYCGPMTADGEVQAAKMNVAGPEHIAFFPSITAHGSEIAVAWEGGQENVDRRTAWGTEVAWARRFTNSRWDSPEMILGRPFKNFDLPKIFFDDGGRLHLTGTKGPRYYTVLPISDAPFQWLTPEWMYHSRGAAFTEDREQNLWAVFDGQSNGTTNEIYLRMQKPSATSWTPAMRISDDDRRPSLYPDVCARDPRQVAVIWMDYRENSPLIYGKLFREGRWTPDLRLSAGAGADVRTQALTPNEMLTRAPRGFHAEYPHIAAAGDGTWWAVWQQSSGSGTTQVALRALRQ